VWKLSHLQRIVRRYGFRIRSLSGTNTSTTKFFGNGRREHRRYITSNQPLHLLPQYVKTIKYPKAKCPRRPRQGLAVFHPPRKPVIHQVLFPLHLSHQYAPSARPTMPNTHVPAAKLVHAPYHVQLPTNFRAKAVLGSGIRQLMSL